MMWYSFSRISSAPRACAIAKIEQDNVVMCFIEQTTAQAIIGNSYYISEIYCT